MSRNDGADMTPEAAYAAWRHPIEVLDEVGQERALWNYAAEYANLARGKGYQVVVALAEAIVGPAWIADRRTGVDLHSPEDVGRSLSMHAMAATKAALCDPAAALRMIAIVVAAAQRSFGPGAVPGAPALTADESATLHRLGREARIPKPLFPAGTRESDCSDDPDE